MEETFDVIVAWPVEAAAILNETGIKGLRASKFKRGIDWDTYKFKTPAEANAFVKGIDLAYGVANQKRPLLHWTMANWENNRAQ